MLIASLMTLMAAAGLSGRLLRASETISCASSSSLVKFSDRTRSRPPRLEQIASNEDWAWATMLDSSNTPTNKNFMRMSPSSFLRAFLYAFHDITKARIARTVAQRPDANRRPEWLNLLMCRYRFLRMLWRKRFMRRFGV